MQSAFNAQSEAAVQLKHLIVSMAFVSVVIWILVMIVLGWALLRANRTRGDSGHERERRLGQAVVSSIVATVLVIAGLTIASFYTTRSLGQSEHAALTVKVRAQQWWWQFIYDEGDTTKTFQTANELHIPTGVDVRIELQAADVIHSFWVPSLMGKRDVIPGRENQLTLRADRPGIYRGQCAEFCGLQHGHMALFVIAQDNADFERWASFQRADATVAAESEAVAGKAVFMAKPCAACHSIRGTGASGTAGPDLTHVASRRTIAAGLLDNTRGALAAWIADPQTLKPGNNMPMVPLSSDELRQLAAYMDSLK
ncbi:cytochrome c oxidase subunit 2 [Rhizobium mesoamericanum]|uniref:cytochrome c oxidase subunit II n=1 Tax=Rhizobium mesoamericanum TaxID=1079800 RepID=UPI0027863DA2|nr:cytochrome c oxidase subunit II [Rhizobium mesoamericanum]MDQ0562505.1 cytochrome c oxidase subunit 2 [Rhizobium mesoamericanum]